MTFRDHIETSLVSDAAIYGYAAYDEDGKYCDAARELLEYRYKYIIDGDTRAEIRNDGQAGFASFTTWSDWTRLTLAQYVREMSKLGKDISVLEKKQRTVNA